MKQDRDVIGLLAQTIARSTREFQAGQLLEDELPTSAEMARDFRLRTDYVKKKLKMLRHEDLIVASGMQPKRYKFNYYRFKSLDESHPFYELLCLPESPYFIEV